MSPEPTAYSTNDPAAVAAFLAAQEAKRQFAARIIAAAKALGNNKGPLRSGDLTDGAASTVGLGPDDPDNPPAGWVHVKTRNELVPKRGKAGDQARLWLKDHQPPAESHLRKIMQAHGLPLNDLLGGTKDGGQRFGLPAIGHFNGTLWALYNGRPGLWWGGDNQPQITWTPRKLSEYYAAQEAAAAFDDAVRSAA